MALISLDEWIDRWDDAGDGSQAATAPAPGGALRPTLIVIREGFAAMRPTQITCPMALRPDLKLLPWHGSTHSRA